MTVQAQGTTLQETSAAPSSDFGPFSEFLVGWVLPGFSPTFYYQVGKRSAWRAVLFFLVFVLVVTVVLTLGLSVSLRPVRTGIHDAFRTGDLPRFTIANGELSVSGQQPFVRPTATGLFVIDTTGTYDEWDMGPTRDDISVLLAKTEYLSYQDGQLRRVAYRDLQPLFGSQPFEFNAATLMRWLDIFVVAAFLTFGFGSTIGWLIYVTLFGLILWGLASLARKEAGFQHVLISGLYATVPAWYTYRLGLILLPQVAFIIAWLVHSAIWVFGLVCMLYPREQDRVMGLFAVRPLRAWRVLVALPLLILLHAALFFPFAGPEQWATAILFVGTAAALITLSVPQIIRSLGPEETPLPSGPGQPPASDALPAPGKSDD